jgi:DNA-binding MarR family transcriptional regulator
MLIGKSSTTRLIRSIEEGGPVRRLRSESDPRGYCLYLGELGKKLLQSASAAHDRYAEDRFSGLDIDVKVLVNDLEAVIHSLER